MKKTVSIKENRTFRRIYNKGRSAVTPFLVLYCRPNGRDHNRLGVTVSTKLGCAVVRNRARRRLREVYRLSTDEETPMTFGERLGSAFSTGLQRGRDNMEELVIGLAANWMTLLLLAAVIAGGVLGLRRLGRRRRKAVPPPQPAGEEKKDE